MLIELPYLRERAVEYALRWALSRNPLFPDFAGIGGDCTNFVSQCVLAGSCIMNDTLDFGWYYFAPTNRAPAWSGVQYFYDFLTGNEIFRQENGGVGPFGYETTLARAQTGDVVQLANEEGIFYHTLIITGFDGDDPLVCAHTNDARNRPLSTYNYATERYLHVEGTRVDINNDACFEDLLNGVAYRPPVCVPGEPILRASGNDQNENGGADLFNPPAP